MRTAASQLDKAIHLYAIDVGQPLSGSQSTGAVANKVCPGATLASGFAGGGSYQCTLKDILVADGQIPSNFFSSLPASTVYGNSRTTSMFYNCANNTNEYALMWNLADPSSADTANLQSIFAACNMAAATYTTKYGMQAGMLIQL